jgi:hypothetical protein
MRPTVPSEDVCEAWRKENERFDRYPRWVKELVWVGAFNMEDFDDWIVDFGFAEAMNRAKRYRTAYEENRLGLVRL